MTETNNSSVDDLSKREIVIMRVSNAPRELVFEAWTDPKHLAEWWGPKGFTTTVREIEVKPGGIWRFVMHSPDGIDYDNKIIFNEIVNPERIVYTHGGEEEGQCEVTVTFADLGGKTKLTMRSLFESVEERDRTMGFGAIEIGNSTLDHLGERLAKMGLNGRLNRR